MPGLDRLGSVLEQLKDVLAATVATGRLRRSRACWGGQGDPEHQLWQVFSVQTRSLIANVQSSPETAAKIRTVQRAVAASSVVDDFSAGAWSDLKAFLMRDCAAADSRVRAKLQEALLAVAAHLEENAENREEINAFVGEEALRSLLGARPLARKLIVDTVQAWDATEMADRLEATGGRDLQFIRLNGTVIGGLIGVAIHTGYLLLGK
jgi:uncharacterized membrane-anchored protein YjiN (DUF445 family)